MLYSRDKKQIRERYKNWLSIEEIQKSFTRKNITKQEIKDTIKIYHMTSILQYISKHSNWHPWGLGPRPKCFDVRAQGTKSILDNYFTHS